MVIDYAEIRRLKPIKLQPRTTYTNRNGTTVHIAGLARTEPFEGKQVYWSIAGNWYLEDGTPYSPRTPWYRPDGEYIKEEDTSRAARAWWTNVKTD